MAKKNEEEFSYGSSFLPSGEKKYSVIRWGWNGLNRTDDIDTGQLSDTSGVICDSPYIYPCKKPKLWVNFATGYPQGSSKMSTAPRVPGVPLGIFGFDNQLAFLWEYHYTGIGYWGRITKYHLEADGDTYLSDHGMSIKDESIEGSPSSIVQFNVVDTSSGNIVEYTYDRKLLVYPFCYSIPYDFTPGGDPATPFNTLSNPVPESNFATVYGSRVFGVTDNAVLGSAYNSYVDYSLDTADDVSSAHAWWSMSQSNTDADGEFTAICTFDNHVVLFKKDFMQLVYNNKNPFRIVDVGKFGCDNSRSWTILNGVLYFASREKVYAFTGGSPKEISQKLDIEDLTGAVLGSYKDTVWMQTKDTMYIYKNGVWSDVGNLTGVSDRVVQFATLDYGLVGLVKYTPPIGEPIYSLWFYDWDVDAMDPAPDDPEEWEPEYPSSWYFETDLMALGRLDIRRVKKFSLMCDGKADSSVSVFLLKDGEEFNPESQFVCSKSFDEDENYKYLHVLTRQLSAHAHRLRFIGRGYVKIYAAELKISWGGDIYVES